jgi:thiol-disulfide isomerase/thioredoxin
MEVVPAIPDPEFRDSSVGKFKTSFSQRSWKDCWARTCIFCLRTIPIMKRLQQKYANMDFR